jgi:hypothetical protein
MANFTILMLTYYGVSSRVIHFLMFLRACHSIYGHRMKRGATSSHQYHPATQNIQKPYHHAYMLSAYVNSAPTSLPSDSTSVEENSISKPPSPIFARRGRAEQSYAPSANSTPSESLPQFRHHQTRRYDEVESRNDRRDWQGTNPGELQPQFIPGDHLKHNFI